MKPIYVLPLVFLLGCANIRLKSWDGNKYTFCSPSAYATPDKFDEAAKKSCPNKPARMIAGGEQDTGNAIIQPATMFTPARVSSSKENCVVYQCGD